MIAVLIAVALFAAQPAGSRTTLALVDRQPLVVRGTGFVPRERVLVIAASGRSVDRRVRASASGTFVVAFPFGVSRCTRAWVRAVGSRGSQARSVLRVAPACESTG